MYGLSLPGIIGPVLSGFLGNWPCPIPGIWYFPIPGNFLMFLREFGTAMSTITLSNF
jgi:hypothetical protein